MSNTPKLRFPEFKGEWEEKRLEEICDPPKYGLNSAGIEFDGIHKYLRITDIDEITHTFSPTDITTPSEFNDEYLLNKNDIVFARTGASTGKTYLYDSNDGDLYFAGFLIKFHVKDANARFVFYQTLTHKYSKWVHVMSTRSGQPGINSEEYGSYKIKLPDIHEQQKIADFLSNVDSIITAETKILNSLQKKKKALMQKLFTQQLRFKFNDGTNFPAWEEKKLGECVEILDSQRKPIESKERANRKGEYPYYGASGIIDYIDDYLFDGEYILLGEDGANIINRTSRLAFIATGKYWVNNHAHIMKANAYNLNYFICEYLESLDYSKICAGSAQPKLTQDVIRNLTIKAPCKAEQQKVADCLSSMDSLIQNQQKIVTTWQQRKKALLQQIFI